MSVGIRAERRLTRAKHECPIRYGSFARYVLTVRSPDTSRRTRSPKLVTVIPRTLPRSLHGFRLTHRARSRQVDDGLPSAPGRPRVAHALDARPLLARFIWFHRGHRAVAGLRPDDRRPAGDPRQRDHPGARDGHPVLQAAPRMAARARVCAVPAPSRPPGCGAGRGGRASGGGAKVAQSREPSSGAGRAPLLSRCRCRKPWR